MPLIRPSIQSKDSQAENIGDIQQMQDYSGKRQSWNQSEIYDINQPKRNLWYNIDKNS